MIGGSVPCFLLEIPMKSIALFLLNQIKCIELIQQQCDIVAVMLGSEASRGRAGKTGSETHNVRSK